MKDSVCIGFRYNRVDKQTTDFIKYSDINSYNDFIDFVIDFFVDEFKKFILFDLYKGD